MTNHKKTEMIDGFDLVSTKIPQFSENLWKIEGICIKTAIKIIFWRPPLSTKNPIEVLLFRKKVPERVDVETLKWYTHM